MTPESTALARELVESALFDVLERRTELLRQAEGDPSAKALRGEAGRLSERIVALRALDAELEGRMTATEVLRRTGRKAAGDIFS